MAVHRLKRGEQARAPLAVEAADGAAQLVDRLRDLGAFGAAALLKVLQLRQFLRGDEVDRADALALCRLPFQLRLFGLCATNLGAGEAVPLGQYRRRTFEALPAKPVGFDAVGGGGLGAGDRPGPRLARDRQRLACLREAGLRLPQRGLGRAFLRLRFLRPVGKGEAVRA